VTDTNVAFAEAYYKSYNEKDLTAIARHLHPAVQLVAPMGKSLGKDAVLEAVKRLLGIVKSIEIRAKFGSGDQVMLAYDLSYGEPAKVCPTAVLMSFKDGLIVRIELFYDARPFGNL
jgi:SnoaL-like domain